uniref:Uncharacterized protein n=1 Tax=Caenorhabditis japonica TaxID=281687 RepID=A0A8R1DSC0_CAEJA
MKSKNMKTTGAILAGILLLAATIIVSNTLHRTYFTCEGKDSTTPRGQDVHFNEYNVLLAYPNWTNPNTVEIFGEDGRTVYKTTGRSPAIVKDEQDDPTGEIQWFAYSANGVVEGDIVYLNEASVADIVHDKIWLVRHSGAFRGNIAATAVKKEAKGLLMYSDPVQVASFGTRENETYSSTDKMPPHAVQRGGVYIGMGDPRTPAFPAIGELYKERTEEDLYAEKAIPTIPILPLPYSDVQILFENMKGGDVIARFKGNLTTYRYGPGLINNQKLRMTVHARNEQRKIQNVLGFIRGSQEPEKYVIVSNHYDAWVYGALDPNSGTASLLEISRALKQYQKRTNWAPARSILFAHWDAEEYGLIGSTEFAEEYREQLMRRAVGIVNMDFMGGNQTIIAIANPTVVNTIRKAAANTEHPNEEERREGRTTLYDSWKHFYPSKTNRSSQPYTRLPAGGSDHMPFFNYLGIPVVFFVSNSLDAPPTYPLYHTIYETPFLVENILDPQFKMHKAIAEMLIDIALQFAESKILPYDLRELMDDVTYDYLAKIEARFEKYNGSGNIAKYLEPGLKQFLLLKKTVKKLTDFIYARNDKKLASLPFNSRVDINNRLIEFEKCFIDPFGAPGNPQSRHLLYYPSPENWYDGNAIAQVHDTITKIENSQNENDLEVHSKRLAKDIALVNMAFICAKHSLDELIKPF